jgi:hypothetical protein
MAGAYGTSGREVNGSFVIGGRTSEYEDRC